MTKGDHLALAATGEFLGAHIDMNTRRTSPFAPQIAANLDRIIAEHSALGWDTPVSGAMKV
jgi:acyl-CoA thioester hydrolase